MLTEIQRIMRDMDMKKRNGGEDGRGHCKQFSIYVFPKNT
jgi:hypothetical protein